MRDWETETEREQERDRERIRLHTESESGSRLWAVGTEPDAGLELMNHEIMTRAGIGHLTDWATQVPLWVLYSVPFVFVSVLTVQSLMWGSIPWTARSWPELKSRVGCSTDWASQPGILQKESFVVIYQQSESFFLPCSLCCWPITQWTTQMFLRIWYPAIR